MERKAVSGIMLILLLVGMLTLAFNIQPANATSLRVHNIDTGEDFATMYKMILDWEWYHNYDPDGPDFPVSVVSDSNNNIIAAGFDTDPAGFVQDSRWRIMKLDSAGNDLWNGGVTDNPTGGRDQITSVAVDSEDNIIAVGFEDPPGSLLSPYWKIMKFDKDKNLLWEKTEDFPPANPEEDNWDDQPYDVAIDKFDDNIIVVGYDYQLGGNNGRWRVMKLYSNGSEMWNKTFNPNPGGSDYAFGVAVDSQSHIIVVGSDNGDWGLKKLDPNGNIITGCDKRIPLSGNYEFPFKVAVDSQDNIIVVGDDKVTIPNVNGIHHAQWRVMKFDSNCNVVWNWTNDWNIDMEDRAKDVAVDSHDNIIVVGYETEGSDYKWRIIKFNGDSLSAEMLWQDTVNPLVGVGSFERAWGVAVIEGASIVVVGSDDAGVPNDFDRQWRIMKFVRPDVRLIGRGWGRIRIEPREYVYGPAQLYEIEGEQIELMITFESKNYSRAWDITVYREHRYNEKYQCYSKEWGILNVKLHRHRTSQFWHAAGRGAIASGFE